MKLSRVYTAGILTETELVEERPFYLQFLGLKTTQNQKIAPKMVRESRIGKKLVVSYRFAR
jgi:hypothetical protein